MDRRNGIRSAIFYVVRQLARSLARSLARALIVHSLARPPMCQLISKTITPRVARHRFELCFMYKGTKYRTLDLKLRIDSVRAFINLADRPTVLELFEAYSPHEHARVRVVSNVPHRIFYADQTAGNAKRYRSRWRKHMSRADATKEVVDFRNGGRDGNFIVTRVKS